MQIVTVQFNYEHGPDYEELLSVFKKSVSVHQPDAEFVEIKIDCPDREPTKAFFMTYNTIKLRYWVDFLEHTDDNVIFADCDMLMLRSAEHAFDIPFDVAYTARQIVYKAPLNGGIMFARPTIKAIDWFKELLEVNDKMYNCSGFHLPWMQKYIGMNQAAMGYLLETGSQSGAVVHKYMTPEWNAVEGDWQRISDQTVFCHLKGKIRECIRLRKFPSGTYRKPLEAWYAMSGFEPAFKTVEMQKRKPKCGRTRRLSR